MASDDVAIGAARALPAVRRATVADAPALAELRWTWRTERGESGTPHDEFIRLLCAWSDAHEASHVALVADAGPTMRPVGMAWLAIVERVPGPARWRRLSGYVQSAYVSPRHRGRGLGAALIEGVIDEAVRRELDYLAVHPSERSFPLYHRLGFGGTGGVLELDLQDRVVRDRT